MSISSSFLNVSEVPKDVTGGTNEDTAVHLEEKAKFMVISQV
jgi:hypothetical protein